MSVEQSRLVRGPQQARSWHAGMLVRRLCLSAVLVMATGLFAQESADQPLGDVARQTRAEREQSGSRRKVYTNDDFAGPAQADSVADSADSDEKPSQGEPAASAKAAEPGAAAPDPKAKDGGAKKEDELQKRTQEMNKQYTDKVGDIQTQIATAKQDLERLQRDQVESTNQYRSSSGTLPSPYEYEEQQRQLQQQMENQRNAISGLNSKLEDAQEAARHAGVRTGE